jgi:hypothetical protein
MHFGPAVFLFLVPAQQQVRSHYHVSPGTALNVRLSMFLHIHKYVVSTKYRVV